MRLLTVLGEIGADLTTTLLPFSFSYRFYEGKIPRKPSSTIYEAVFHIPPPQHTHYLKDAHTKAKASLSNKPRWESAPMEKAIKKSEKISLCLAYLMATYEVRELCYSD
jgi:hypothetical protein